MFSGIIETIRNLIEISTSRVVIENNFYNDIKKGESISINGICLTVVDFKSDKIFFDVSQETFRVTNLKFLKRGDYVNVERALKVGDRVGGHFVTGHIDEVGYVDYIIKKDDFYVFRFKVSSIKFLVQKGSVSVNGVSLTTYDVNNSGFSVAIIPHTYSSTNLKYLKKNSPVNIEYDILAKYSLSNKTESKITIDFLKENGFV